MAQKNYVTNRIYVTLCKKELFCMSISSSAKLKGENEHELSSGGNNSQTKKNEPALL